MPANLTPQYLEAEKRYRAARTPEEKIEALEEMLRLLPRHKGTDHLHAELRKRLAKLRAAQARPKGGARQRSPYQIRPSGAGQVVFVGMPNAGKSALVAGLSGRALEAAPYPFTTRVPAPAMMRFENAQVQLVDTPPMTPDGFEPGLTGLLRQADLTVLVLNLAEEDVLEDAETALDRLANRRLELVPPDRTDADPHATARGFLVGTHADLAGAHDRLQILREFFGGSLPIHPVSAETREGLEPLRRALWTGLGVIRVYTQAPGRKADLEDPVYLPRGSTVQDFAAKIHRELARRFKAARVWGSAPYPGQYVRTDFPLADGDIVELHT